MTVEKLPYLTWVKHDARIHQKFQHGSVFLVAVPSRDGPDYFDMSMIEVEQDDEGDLLYYANSIEPFDRDWLEVEFFILIKGAMPYREKLEMMG